MSNSLCLKPGPAPRAAKRGCFRRHLAHCTVLWAQSAGAIGQSLTEKAALHGSSTPNCYLLASMPTANALLLWSLRRLRLQTGLSPLAPQSDVKPFHCAPASRSIALLCLQQRYLDDLSDPASKVSGFHGGEDACRRVWHCLQHQVARQPPVRALGHHFNSAAPQAFHQGALLIVSCSQPQPPSGASAEAQHTGMQASGGCVECHTVVAVTAAAAR